MRTLIIVPAHNEADNLPALVRALRGHAPDADILVVNDASTDDTAAVARGLGVAVADLPFNLGIGGAVQTGYLFARRHGYDAAVQVDGDGQHDPAFLADLLAPLSRREADVVVGSRFLQNRGFQSSLWRRQGIKIIRGLLGLVTGQRYTDPTSGFRAANRRAIALFADYYPHDFPEPESLVTLSRCGFRVREVHTVMHDRTGGSSSIIGWRTVYYMFKVCLAILIEKLKRHRVVCG